MVDSLSRSPSPAIAPDQVSGPYIEPSTLRQGVASRSQSPGATSLMNQGRNARELPTLQPGSPASPPRANRGERSPAPSPPSWRPSPGGGANRLPTSSLQSLADEVSAGPSPRQALRAWARQGDAEELRAQAMSRINSARTDSAESLDLSDLRLTSLPDRLGQLLPAVRVLAIENNRLESVAALTGMHMLNSLDLSGNRLESLASLPALRSLQILVAEDNPLSTPDDSLLSRMPALTQVYPSDTFTPAQQAALRTQMLDIHDAQLAAGDTHSAESVLMPVAAMADQEDYESPMSEAASRWGDGRSKARAEEQALAFYRSVMPDALHEQLQTDRASRSLLTLAAGMAFTADNDRPNDHFPDAVPSASKAVLTADLQYLHDAKDPALLADCQRATDYAMNDCADHVSYGATQLHQVIEAHQFKTGSLSATELFEGKARHFNQRLVEAKADEIAGKGNPGESVEYYQDLAAKVAAKGRPLVEKSASSLFGSLFTVSDQQVQETLDLIDAKSRNPAYLDTFNDHKEMVNEVLRKIFASSFATLLADREREEDEQTTIMLKSKKDSPEEFEAGFKLGLLGQKENQWYADRLPELLGRPELLKQLG